MNVDYLQSSIKQFAYYKSLGDKTFTKLNQVQMFEFISPESNSIAIVVKHLWVNMLSRWTDFLTTDGEKPWRNRDAEFENDWQSKEQIIEKWNEGWNCLFNALNSITEADYGKLVYIRNEGHTITEAINRQLCHYAYHVGQIVFIGKVLQDDKWTSLSIPKGKTASFNAEKFSKEKERKHFTDK